MLQATEIRMEYLLQPVGFSQMPWFGWIIKSDRTDVTQKAYHLQISADKLFSCILYDSGWVVSSNSTHVRVEMPVSSCTRYFVRVRIDDGVEISEFSEPSSFVTAIIHKKEWKCQFISAETQDDWENSKSTLLRREITLKGEVKEAFICSTALGLYQLFLNGNRVGTDELTPGWTSYQKHLCYQTYEVTSLLCTGNNTLGAMVGAGWYKGKMGFLHLRNNYGRQTAFLMQMVVRYQDGTQEIFGTDSSWKGVDGPVVFSEIYDGETYDAAKTSQGWNQNYFDDSHWKPVGMVDFPIDALTAQAGGKVTVKETIKAQRVFQTPKGETVIDFGQNLTGWVHFKVRGEKGQEASLQCFETLDAHGNVYTENLRTALQTVTYRCAGQGQEEFHPHFTFMGFQYVKILSWPCPVKAEDFTALVLYSDMEETGTFSCSHPLVNQLQHNILWGLKGNFVDIPTDCPQRDERMGWTGDAQIFCRTACYLMNTYTFYRKWLKDVAADQTEEGGVPHVVPDIISGKEQDDWLLSQGTHSAAAWADVAVINPWTMYLVYGDTVILQEQYESMKKWIRFMQKHSRDFIWNYRLQFGDWVALDAEEGSYFGATPNDLTCTAYYAYSTGLFAKIARILGKTEDAEEFYALYLQIRDKYQKTFFDADGYLTAQTQTAHIVSLYFDLTPESLKQQTAQRLVELLRQENGHLVTGFVGTPYFCHALSQQNYAEEAYRLLLQEDFPSWLYQVKMGATTVWEHWDGKKPDGTMWSPDMNSFNHYAYGAVGDWLYRVVLGIEVDENDPGYHHILIHPVTGTDFQWAQGCYHSLYGDISVRWEKLSGNRYAVRVEIPHNTTAAFQLEKQAEIEQADGVEFQDENGIQTANFGSGVWNIIYKKV